MSALLLVLIVATALLGAPLFAAMFLGTAVVYAGAHLDLTNVFIEMGTLQDEAFLLPIPLFTFAGYLLARSNTPKRVVRLARAWVGWIPGGLAVVTVLTCALFTTLTGASGVTIVALGGLLFPILLEQRYPERFALGLLTSSGSIGLLFFPALPIFVFSTVFTLSAGGRASLEPGTLFAGGFLPGLLMVGAVCAWSVYVGLAAKVERQPFELREALAAVRGAWGELLLPVLLLAFLQTGTVSVNEIAVLTVVYVLLLEVVIYRDIHWRRDLPRVVRESMELVGAIVVILSVILGLNNYLTHAEIPQHILAALKKVVHSRIAFLAMLNVFLLIVGCLMDIFSAIVAVLPLLIPLALDFHIAPVHLGVIFLANLEIGYMTPPVGMNLFISSFQFDRPVLSVYRSVVPFIGLLALVLLTITYVPSLTTWLPDQLAHAHATAASGGSGTTGAPGGDEDDLMKELEQDDDLDEGDEGGASQGNSGGEDDLLKELERGDDLDEYLEEDATEPTAHPDAAAP